MTNDERTDEWEPRSGALLLPQDFVEWAKAIPTDVRRHQSIHTLRYFWNALAAAEARGLERAAAMVRERYWTTLSPETKKQIAAAICALKEEK